MKTKENLILRFSFLVGGISISSHLLKLSSTFFEKYSIVRYPEILYKTNRAYNVVVCKGIGDYYICAPFRSHIKHKEAFIFRHTKRSKNLRSGIDYKKIVIINNQEYLNWKDIPVIDDEEYLLFLKFREVINKEMVYYVQTYIDYTNGIKPLSVTEFERKYKYSCLPYFHKELGLN